MYKASLLTLCLLICTIVAVAQERAPQPRSPNPDVQRAFDTVRAMTPEQRARIVAAARGRGTVSISDQHPLTPPPATGVLGGFLDYTPDPNLLKHGPFGPNVTYGPLGPIGEGGARQSANVQPNLGVGWNLEGFKHPLDKVSNQIQEGFKQATGGINQSIEATDRLKEVFNNQLPRLVDQYQQQIGVSNQPPVSPPADPVLPPLPPALADFVSRTRNTVGVRARAAARPKPDIRKVDTKSGELIVRSNPKGYYVGLLNEKQDKFQVKAKHEYINKDGKKVCWALGDTLGTVKLDDVWVNCDGLEKKNRDVRRATGSEIPDAGYESARHLEDRFASLIAPVTTTGQVRDAKDYVVVTQDTILYGNYPLSRPPNLDGSKPPQGKFSDEIRVVPAAPCHAFKVRYFSNDGNAVVGKYVRKDPQTGETVESEWGILPTANISLPLREGSVPCK